MNRVSEIISGCTMGISAKCIYESSYSTIFSASRTCQASNSADTFFFGSFCPKRAGQYKILPKGTIRETKWSHVFKFDSKDYSLNSEISLSLKAGRCYSYQLSDCDLTSSSASIEITYNNKKYILGKEESITCQYSGFLPKSFNSCKRQSRCCALQLAFIILLL